MSSNWLMSSNIIQWSSNRRTCRTFTPLVRLWRPYCRTKCAIESLPYNIDHKILTGKYDLSMDLSNCVEYEFSIYGLWNFIIKFIQIDKCVVSVRLQLIWSYWKYCQPDRMPSMTLNNLMTTASFDLDLWPSTLIKVNQRLINIDQH